MPRIDMGRSPEEWEQGLRAAAEQIVEAEEARDKRRAEAFAAAISRAQETAGGRKDYYVLVHTPQKIEGPYSEGMAHVRIESLLKLGKTPLLLKVIEDYL